MHSTLPTQGRSRALRVLGVAWLFAVVITIGVITWQVMRPVQAPALWLQVEGPSTWVVSQPLLLRMTLPAPASAGMLSVDLHEYNARREPLAYWEGDSAQAVTSAGGVFTVEFPVTPDEEVRYVAAVIYLGPTSDWDDRIRVAKTEEIEVLATSAEFVPALVPLHAYDDMPVPAIKLEEGPLLQSSVAALWVLAALAEGRRIRRDPARLAVHVNGAVRRLRYWLVVACLVAALVEGCDVVPWLASYLRGLGLTHHLYFERHGIQEVVMLAALVAAVGTAWLAGKRVQSTARSLAVYSLLSFCLVSVAAAISHHNVDLLLAVEVGPLTLIELLKLVTAGSAAAGLWWEHRSKRP